MTKEDRAPLSWRRRLRRRFYHALLVGVLTVAGWLPLGLGRRFGRGLVRLAVAVRPAERQRALANLALAFPTWEAAARRRLLRASEQALGDNFFDTLTAGRWLQRPGFVVEEVNADGLVLADQLRDLARGSRGVLILTGHLGCWELLGGWLAGQVADAGLGQLAVVTGVVHNAPVDRLLQGRRQALGMKILPRSAGARPLLRHLAEGGVAAVLLDQNTHVENRRIPFFGQPAPTPVGFARIALRYGVPVLSLAMARQDRFHVVRRGAVWRPTGPGESSDAALDGLLNWCNRGLEDLIRRNPKEWVWFHKRWD